MKRGAESTEKLGPASSECIWTRGSISHLAVVLALVFAAALSGCTGAGIRVDSSDPGALRSAARIDVVLVPVKAGEQPGLSEATTAALLDRVREALRAKGHPVFDGGDRSGIVVLELALLEREVSRRTYTADTDANGTRLEKRTEAIVALRAVGADRGTELWRCDARGLLPKRDAPFGPSESELFDRMLERALARVPAHL